MLALVPRPPVPLLLPTLLLCVAFTFAFARPAPGAGRALSSHGPAGAGHASPPSSSSSSSSSKPTWRRPVPGAVVRRFRLARDPFARGQHRGVTLAAAPGAAVLAPCTGRVRFAGTVGTSGPTVTIGCGALNATLTHLGAVLTARRAGVAAGQVVGRMGPDGIVQLGARVRAQRFGYLDPLTLLAAESAPRLGPAPPPGRRPFAPPPPLAPRPTTAPAPATLPFGSAWLPAGLGLLGAAGLFGAARTVAPLLRRRRLAVAERRAVDA